VAENLDSAFRILIDQSENDLLRNVCFLANHPVISVISCNYRLYESDISCTKIGGHFKKVERARNSGWSISKCVMHSGPF